MSWLARMIRSPSQGDLVQVVAREWRMVRVPDLPDRASRVAISDSRFTADEIRPIPILAPSLTPGRIQRGTRADNPVFYKLTIPGWIGSHVRITFMSDRTAHLAVWGPDPLQIGTPWGRMRMPLLGQSDILIGTSEGNFTPGTYYLEVASTSTAGPVGPLGDYSILILRSCWRWW